jgi:hypothetical protein
VGGASGIQPSTLARTSLSHLVECELHCQKLGLRVRAQIRDFRHIQPRSLPLANTGSFTGLALNTESPRGQHLVPAGTHAEKSAMWSKKITLTGAILTMLLFAGSAVPAVAQTATDQTTARDMNDGDGFDDWGLLGLLGLAGLLGRGRKDRTVVTDTRRV